MLRMAPLNAHTLRNYRWIRFICGFMLGLSGWMLAAPQANAQESLEAILDRGYVAHWLVCGPFSPDLEGGIAAALRRGAAPLGNRDYMEPVGGIARLRPEHLKRVKTESGEAIWQRAGTQDYSLDLAPFFPEAAEGVAYAAFYAEAAAQTQVYLDLQTPLGARAWFNGFPVRDIRPATLTSAGVDRFVLMFRPGRNLLVLEVPGIAYAALAKAAGIPEQELGARAFLNRPLLQGTSGYEIALRLQPAAALGNIIYVPRLEFAGMFSGTENDVRQEMLLTFFNTGDKPSPAIDLLVTTDTLLEPLAQKIPAIPPADEWKERLAIPTGVKLPGQSIAATIRLSAVDPAGLKLEASLAVNVPVQPRLPGGRVYVVTGQRYRPETAEDQAAETGRRNSSYLRQMLLADREKDYGFDLGTTTQWKPAIVARPEFRDALLDAAGRGRCAAQAAYVSLDERLVGGETLARNIIYGVITARSILHDTHSVYYAWEIPGVAVQTPQLLSIAGIPGIISNLEIGGLPPVFRHVALNGSRVFHRHKRMVSGPKTLDALRQRATLERRELLDMGIASDVFINNSITSPPEPFFAGATADLLRSYPSIRVQAGGAYEFFQDLESLPVDTADRIPPCSRLMTTAQPGMLPAQPDLKRAYVLAEQRLRSAEKLATFAALLGAQYPGLALDYAWRQILYWSGPDALGFAATEQQYIDTLAGYRDAAEAADELAVKSMAYIAREADTLRAAPNTTAGVTALVTFNPSSWGRSEICETYVTIEDLGKRVLLDDLGNSVPYVADRFLAVDTTSARRARLRFVASKVPAMGYRTYYLAPGEAPAPPSVRQNLQIENEFLLLIADPRTGDIRSLVDKTDGTEYAQGPLNRIVALSEDPSQNDNGRELWTTGERIISNTSPAEMNTLVSDGMQRLTITTPFAGGKLIREMRLYRGIPRVDCETRIEGVTLDGRIIAASFAPPAQGRVPVYGERFGAVLGRRSQGTLDYRTKGRENLSGAALQPACAWAALSPNDYIQVAGEGAVCLQPAIIVYGSDRILERAAREIQETLIKRGIPAAMYSDTPKKPDFLWTDSTEYPDWRDELAYGGVMQIVIGGPSHNRLCGALLKELPKDVVEDLSQRLEQGAKTLFESTIVPQGRAPVPTLLLAGLDPARSASLAEEFAASIRGRGVCSLPASSYVSGAATPAAGFGFAVLFRGTRLCSTERDGSLIIALAHGSSSKERLIPEGNGSVLSLSKDLVFEYALYPFRGDWRDAAVPRAALAYSEPLIAAVTDVHSGHQPAVQSFLEVPEPNLLVSMAKAAGYPHATMRSAPNHPRDGIVVRIWESTGRPCNGSLQCFSTLRRATQADLLDELGEALPITNDSTTYRAEAFSVFNLWLLPSTRFDQGPMDQLGRDSCPYGPIHTRYWQHNLGVAPLGFQPITALLDGALGEGEARIQATIANHLSDRVVEGTACLKASDGWTLGPAQFSYRLEPGAFQKEDIVVLHTGGDITPGGIELTTAFENQTYRDILQTAPAPLHMAVTRTNAQIKVSIENRGGLAAEGFVDLITPSVFWPELGALPEITILPRRAAVFVAPFSAQDILFRFSNPDVVTWAVAKLAANGHVLYQRLPE